MANKVPHVGAVSSAVSASYLCAVMGSGFSTTEAEVQFYVTKAGTFSGLGVYISGANGSGTSTFTFRINGADATQTLTVSSGATGWFSDTTHSDAVSVGDLITIGVTTSAGSITVASTLTLFEATSGDSVQFLMSANSGLAGWATASANRFVPLAGIFTINVTQADAQQYIYNNTVASNLALYAPSNTRTTNTTFAVRQNGGVANNTLAFGSGVSGLLRDTTHTDSITAGDLVGFRLVTGSGTGTITIRNAQLTLTSSNAQEITLLGAGTATRSSTASSIYGRVIGSVGDPASTEDANSVVLGASGIISKWSLYVSANASNRDMDIYVRQNVADTSLIVSNALGTTGWFSDTTHSVSVSPTDTLASRSIISSGGVGAGNVTYRTVVMLFTFASADDFIPQAVWF